MQKVAMQTEEQIQNGSLVKNSSVFSAVALFMDKITPAFARDARQLMRESGMRAVVKKYGWKFFAAFFAYYLIRDSILYILLPYLITQGILS